MIAESNYLQTIRIGQEQHTAEKGTDLANRLIASSTLCRTLAPPAAAPSNLAPASRVLTHKGPFPTLIPKVTSTEAPPKPKAKHSKATP